LGIARNHARRRYGERRHEELPTGTCEPATRPDLSEPIAAAEDRARLRAALATLPEQYRAAVVLCDLQELSYDEAAVAAGCAVGTIRSRLHRGRALLGARLRGERGAWAGWPATEWL
jgi:RNA polymerase sigma-70 factor (ECF subfamily)